MRNAQKLVFAAALAASAGLAGADTASADFFVRLTITKSCTIGATDLSFGTHARSTSGATSGSGNHGAVEVNCTPGTSYHVSLSHGDFFDTQRRMRHVSVTTAYVPYRLSANPTMTGDWDLTNTVSGIGSGSAQSHAVYGQVTSLDVEAGDYIDQVVATVTY